MKPLLLLICGILFILYSFCSQRNTVTDADGNIYPTVRIGSQIWTAENLRATKFNDGTPIPHVPDSVAWHDLTSPGFCYYGNMNNTDSIVKFGALYNWYCVDSKKLAPQGWHVPTNDDWAALQNYLIEHGYNWDRRKDGNRIAKSLAIQSDWKPFITEGMPGNNMKENNRSGFSGFAAGYRYDTRETINGNIPRSIFAGLGHKAGWWSATQINESEAYAFGLGFCVEKLIQWDMFLQTCGYSVRLVKNAN
ncbi:MAG: fibrobacter succinogenes major paralogous domain-containing protein [Deltaproteobacteria bacterium]|nr:fibrobacter succinogenes major paralogous domain-containing protein [Deltaproteobacteria bacterium]